MGSVKAKWEKQTRIQSHMHPDPINKPTHHEEQPQPEEVAIIGKPPQVDVQIRCIVKVLLPVQSLLLLPGVHRTEQHAIPFPPSHEPERARDFGSRRRTQGP